MLVHRWRFYEVSSAEVYKLIGSIPNKSSPRDVLLTSLLKSCPDEFVPLNVHLINPSLAYGAFPNMSKAAWIFPLLKTLGPDRINRANYRPIPKPRHNIKDIRMMGLGLSLPTSTDVQQIQLTAVSVPQWRTSSRLPQCCRWQVADYHHHARGTALSRLRSYLTEIRSPLFWDSGMQLRSSQGSAPGPLLFTASVKLIGALINRQGFDQHQYTDDTQLCMSKEASSITAEIHKLESCLQAVEMWFADNYFSMSMSMSS